MSTITVKDGPTIYYTIGVFDGLRQQFAANRAQFYFDLASGPLYGYNRPGAKVSPGRDRELVAAGHDGRREGAFCAAFRKAPQQGRPEGL